MAIFRVNRPKFRKRLYEAWTDPKRSTTRRAVYEHFGLTYSDLAAVRSLNSEKGNSRARNAEGTTSCDVSLHFYLKVKFLVRIKP